MHFTKNKLKLIFIKKLKFTLFTKVFTLKINILSLYKKNTNDRILFKIKLFLFFQNYTQIILP